MRARVVLLLSIGLGLGAGAACSAPSPPPDLVRAEHFEHEGNDHDALASYEAAVAACPHVAEVALRRKWCAAALLGRAGALEHVGRKREAAAAYEAIPRALPDWTEPWPLALVEAGRLWLAVHEDERAYTLWWGVITRFPDSTFAEEALRDVVKDGRHRNPRQLFDVLVELQPRLAETELGDNLVFDLAMLAKDDLHDPKTALAMFDRLVAEYPKSPLADDALWYGAELARAAKDPEGALRRYRALTARRERSYLIGSYNSVWMDDAQLAQGVVLRDDLHRPDEAVAAFSQLAKDYPDSILRDDALWEIAVTRDGQGDAPGTCGALSQLAEHFPTSKFLSTDGRALARKRGCSVKLPPE